MIDKEYYARRGDNIYTLKSISPKSGELRDIHKRMKIGGLWVFLDAPMPGQRPYFLFEDAFDNGDLRHVCMSEIVACISDENTTTIITKNTTYVFERVRKP